MDGARPSLALIVGIGLVLGQLAGCGSCVKDEPVPETAPEPVGAGRRPLNAKAFDKNLSQFSDANLARDVSTPMAPADASTD